MQRAVALCIALLAGLPALAPAQQIVDRELAIEALKHTDYGLRYLRNTQGSDGAWSGSVTVTALALRAFLESYQRYNEADGAFVTRPVNYLLAHVRDDGSIGSPGEDRIQSTAAAMIALHATRNPRHEAVVRNAQSFLKKAQADERRGIGEDDARYGGIGDADGEATIQTHLHAVEALHFTGLDPADPVWARSLRFLGRLQNLAGSNDRGWAGRDGGFVAAIPAAGATTVPSSAPATYAGIAGLVACGLGDADARVEAGRSWIRRHWAFEAPPGLDSRDGLFAYLAAVARGMRVFGDPVVAGPDGANHVWRDDLIKRLLALHRADGSWGDGTPGAGAGGDPALATAQAVNALNEVIRSFR